MAITDAPSDRRRLPLAAVALAGGCLTPLAFAPTRWLPLLVIGPALGLWAAARAGSGRAGAVYGALYGWAFSLLAFRWMLELDIVAGLVLPAIQGCFYALVGAVAAVAARLRPGWWVCAVAATWTLVEATRARVPLTGFEWGQLSMGTPDLPIRQATAIVGALGVTGLLAVIAAGLAVVAPDVARRRWIPLAAGVALIGVAAGLGTVRWTAPDGRLTVTVVQVGDPCPGTFAQDCPGYSVELLRRYIAGTRDLGTRPDLILWGEDALLGARTLAEVGARLVERSGDLPAPLLAGAGTPTTPGRFLRWAALFDVDGTSLDGYAKRIPVPFGEYVPLRSLLGGISEVGRLVPSDLEAGWDASPVVLPLEGGAARLGTVVSWEVTFSRAVRAVAADANGLATLTTVASYDTSAAADQLLDAAQLRAAEHQKPMVVAATTGRSAIIGPTGAMDASSALQRADQLAGALQLRSGLTPYARYGDLPVVLIAALSALAAGLALRRATVADPSRAVTDATDRRHGTDALRGQCDRTPRWIGSGPTCHAPVI